MSLTLALRTALSGLQLSQAALQVTSNNISNVNTEGYTRKTVTSIPNVVAGTGVGVLPSDIARTVDENLLRDMRLQLGDIGIFAVRNEIFSQTQAFFGTPESSTSLTARATDLASRIEALATSPEDVTLRQQVISAALTLTRQMNDMANEIQEMRGLVDRGIADSVGIVRTELDKIHALNSQISRNTATGQPIADLEDQRDLSLNRISEQIDITYFYRTTGEVVIQTSGGTSLLDGAPSTLSHTAAGGVDASVVFVPPNGGFDGVFVNGIDITQDITSGRIFGLVEMRDTTLPAFNAQLDQLATAMRDGVNAIHNDGAALPPINTMTGTRTVTGVDLVGGGTATGTVRIGVLNQDGTSAFAPMDLDLAALEVVVGAGTLDVQDIVDAINGVHAGAGIAGLQGGTASLDANGNLVIAATSASQGVAINEGSSAIDDGGVTKGFSNYFGMNDFFVGDGSVSLARQMTVRADLAANPHLISRGELSETYTGAGDQAISTGDGSVIQQIAAAFAADQSFPAAGGLPPLTVNFAEYGAQILSSNAGAAAEAADGLNFREIVLQDLQFRVSSQSGVNIDEELAHMVQLQQAFSAAARIFTVTSEMMDILADIG